MNTGSRAIVFALALAGLVGASMTVGAQYRDMRHNFGDNVVPVFEGWEKNADGSFSMVFGYLNRNYEEQPEIPVGPDNNLSPGSADQGQPTHFYTRRQQFMFKIRVPADFGKKELVWTLTRNGKTEKAYATLMLEEELTPIVMSQNRGGLASNGSVAKPNLPPAISIEGGSSRTIAVGEKLALVASVSDDGNPVPPPVRPGAATVFADGVALQTAREAPPNQAVVKPNRAGLGVTWTHWRGAGQMTFEPMTALVKEGKVSTNVSFKRPGTYVIRVYADDGVVTTPADITVTVTGDANPSGQ
jgi:hypothetical protein